MPAPVAVVTGASRGIGRAAALALVAAGYDVVATGRNADTLAETASRCTEPARCTPFVADVTDEAAVAALFDFVASRFGRIDVLFNNAGIFTRGAPIDELTVAEWRAAVDTNLTGVFLCARAAVALMKRQQPQGGRIINNGSISAHTPRPLSVPYTSTKHALTGLTKAISLEGRAFNIACGQIDIGNAATEMTSGIGLGALQADGTRRAEPLMDVAHAASAVVYMAGLPLSANVQFMTITATTMPFVGRG
jgi:NAD(P)-dependent dehydrogenase (short-subunit alcohol dehydrogenase family)